MPVIGFLDGRSPDGMTGPLRGFHQGLKETRLRRGRERGDRISLGRNQLDRLPALAAELVRRQVAVIAAIDSAAAVAAKAATTTIPIVFMSAMTRSGSVLSPALPGRAET